MQSSDGGDRRSPGGGLFEDLSKIAGGALGAAGGVKADLETAFRAQASRLIAELDLVRREDFEAAREMAAKARAEQERLQADLAQVHERLAALEAKIANQKGSAPVSPQESSESSVES